MSCLVSVDKQEVGLSKLVSGLGREHECLPCNAEAWRIVPEVPSITLILPRLVTAKIALRAGW